MHQPKTFIETNPHTLRQLVSDYPLATLLVTHADGVAVNHIPLLWSGNELHGHIARANELLGILTQAQENTLVATAIFHGPQGYISPADYPSKVTTGKVVPTWNYAVVHIAGNLALRDDPVWVRQQVDALTLKQEVSAIGGLPGAKGENRSSPWSLADAPAAYSESVIQGIVGVVLAIEKTEGKFKLSQNRPPEDRRGATEGVRRRGQQALAELMKTTTS